MPIGGVVPLAHILSRRINDRQNRVVDRSPFITPPRVGLFGRIAPRRDLDKAQQQQQQQQQNAPAAPVTGGAALPSPSAADAQAASAVNEAAAYDLLPFKCTQCEVTMHSAKVVKARIASKFLVATEDFDLYLPISECGGVSNVQVFVNGHEIEGDIVRRGPLYAPEGYLSSAGAAPVRMCPSEGTTCDKDDKVNLQALSRHFYYNRDTNGLIYPPEVDSAQSTGESKGKSSENQKLSGVTGGVDQKHRPLVGFLDDVEPSYSEMERRVGKQLLATMEVSATSSCSAANTDVNNGLRPRLRRPRLTCSDSQTFPVAQSEERRRVLTASTGVASADEYSEPVVFYIFYRGLSEWLRRKQAMENNNNATNDGKKRLPRELSSSLVGRSVEVVLSYTTQLIAKEPGGARYHLMVPLSCCPAPPQQILCDLNMTDNIQRVLSLNPSHQVAPMYDGNRAAIIVQGERFSDQQDKKKQKGTGEARKGEEDGASSGGSAERSRFLGAAAAGKARHKTRDGRNLLLEDYIFVLVIELGPPIIPQCADPVTLLVLISAIAVFVFASLTAHLEVLE